MDYMAPWLFWTLFLILWSTVVILGVLNWRRAGSRLNSHYPAPFVADPEEDPSKFDADFLLRSLDQAPALDVMDLNSLYPPRGASLKGMPLTAVQEKILVNSINNPPAIYDQDKDTK